MKDGDCGGAVGSGHGNDDPGSGRASRGSPKKRLGLTSSITERAGLAALARAEAIKTPQTAVSQQGGGRMDAFHASNGMYTGAQSANAGETSKVHGKRKQCGNNGAGAAYKCSRRKIPLID